MEQTTTTLDDWIGERISVQFVTREEALLVTLKSADERGVLVEDPHTYGGSVSLLFFPWHRIEHIRKMP